MNDKCRTERNKILAILATLFLLFIIIHYSLNNSSDLQNETDSVSESESFVPRSDKYMVYFCDGSFHCGGWADRLKGIVATYLIANATNRRFGIHMIVPCDISRYLLPNLIDWRIDKSKMLNDSQFYMGISDAELGKYSQVMNLNEMFPHQVTYFAYNLDIVPFLRYNKLYSKNLSWLSGMKNHEIYSLIYKTLFRFSSKLEIRLQEFNLNHPVGASLKCAQIRLGRNPTNSKDTEVRSKYSDVPLIWNFFRSYVSHHSDLDHDHSHHHGNHHHGNHHHGITDNFKIFVTSDSEQVRSDAASLFPNHIVDLPGELVHIERSTKTKNEICDGFSKVLLDQIILASCETLIISKSGFGELSSFLRGKDTNLYCFRYSKLYKCSMSNFDLDIHFVIKIVTLSIFTIIVKVLFCCFCLPSRLKLCMKNLVRKLLHKYKGLS